MQARYFADLQGEGWLHPEAPAWRRSPARRVALIGTPVGLQPTAAVRVAWTGKKVGAVDAVRVTALHDGRRVAFRLEWEDASEDRVFSDTTSFADAAAVLLPSTPASPLVTMGAPGAAVTAWYWRADEAEGRGRHVVSEGLGTTRTLDQELVSGHGVWKDGRWQVVLARPLRVDTREPVAQLAPGRSTRFGIAIWDGSHEERAGIKSFSGDWLDLGLDGMPASGR